MPPQIVGSIDGEVDPGTFVIADEDGDEDEEFELVNDMEMAPPPPSPHGSPRGLSGAAASASPQAANGSSDTAPGLRSAGFGESQWEVPPPAPPRGSMSPHSDHDAFFAGPVFSGQSGPVE